MMLIIHILIAISSLITVAFTLTDPSIPKLKTSYAALVLTLATGAYLVVSTGSHMLHACIMGLVYVGVMTGGIALSHRRLVNHPN